MWKKQGEMFYKDSCGPVKGCSDTFCIKALDYLAFLKSVSRRSVDFICIDPPYGKNQGLILTGQDKAVDWDETINWKEMFKEFHRVLKPGGTIAVFGQNPTYAEMILSNKAQYKYEFIWIKNNCAQGFHSEIMPLTYSENIAIFIKDGGKRTFNKILTAEPLDKEKYPAQFYSQQLELYLLKKYNLSGRIGLYKKLPLNAKGKLDRRLEFFFFWSGSLFNKPAERAYQTLIDNFNIDEWEHFMPYSEMKKIKVIDRIVDSQKYTNTIKNTLYFSKDKQGLHPTQKPLALIEFLVKTYSSKNDIVLDCFLGSGTTAVAAIKNERIFIGCEKNWNYYEKALKRVKQIAEKKFYEI